ncbi:MAG TPA: UbiD family decarboxylase [Chloroflexota bacterium]
MSTVLSRETAAFSLAGSGELRAHLRELEARGKLVRVSRAINKDTEMHPLVRWQFRGLPESERKAFLFEQVYDSRGREHAFPVVVGALATSEEVYSMAVGCPGGEVPGRWRKAMDAPLEPVLVEDAPVQEVVHAGEELLTWGALDALPVPISTPGFDNAPYFNSGIWIVRDPETGVRNAGLYRGMIKSATRTGIFSDSSKDTTTVWEKCNREGRPLEAAAVIGAAPAVYFSAIQIMPFGTDELSVAGALQGHPVELVKCKTMDLEVPAEAEFVVEGIIHTDHLEPEGAFGEAHGYVDPRSLSLAFEVKAITHRAAPIYLSIISQLTPSESSKTKQAGYEASLLRYLREGCGLRGVKQVVLREELLNRLYGVVVIDKVDRYEPMNALYAMLNRRAAPKILVAVDEDIDPHNDTMINWAIVNRCQPHRDLTIVHPRPLPFGPLRYVGGSEGYEREDSCVLIDATRKADFPPVALPKREYMERARDIWNELGLPELQPRTPWHGYSLGRWPRENADEAELALQGRYYETGAKLMEHRVPTPPGTKLHDIRRHDLH